MAINIKDAATDELARQLASLTGESLTTAVRVSIEERHSRVLKATRRRQGAAKLQGYIDRARALPRLDEASLEDFLYDEDGFPA